MQITITLPTIEEVEFETHCLPEDEPIRGNAMASGDPEHDREVEEAIWSDLQSNQWAWCCVRVVCKWRGEQGDDYLGGCSYKSQEEFEQLGEYYDDMKQQAYDDLLANLTSLADES